MAWQFDNTKNANFYNNVNDYTTLKDYDYSAKHSIKRSQLRKVLAPGTIKNMDDFIAYDNVVKYNEQVKTLASNKNMPYYNQNERGIMLPNGDFLDISQQPQRNVDNTIDYVTMKRNSK